MKFQVGDRVRVRHTQLIAASQGPWGVYIGATEGSIGVVVEESGNENNNLIQIRIETLAPYTGPFSEDDAAFFGKAGGIEYVRTEDLEKI